ncbi:epoxyqueuosine reductase QueH [Dehalococcoides mccartyi]|uniref:epoxyqueuosine reductase QueH n=1 Tax=Dehalococcoides mccartyi TaxID=61435 RepID=UPI0006BE03B4|nr:epoxyqueuosine reductase QueH [Dehalococcoides mccartyi]BAS31651.1 hypothetical protein IBK_0581 [Dehalococcoides mccartyi IBARAKI]BEL00637.1 epoxyqueuosine reductase QueH [Dehalococcoides mccartyi]
MAAKLLLHGCCAHCTAYSFKYWQEQGFEVSVYWYNPNIHPFTEHQNRLEAMVKLSQELSFELVTEPLYQMAEYFKKVAEKSDERCRTCFDMRLGQTAVYAARYGYEYFSSSLFISPHQKHQEAVFSAEAFAKETGVKFAYADLRKRYSDSRHITKPLDLYRQQYCGCIYSEYERFGKTDPPA